MDDSTMPQVGSQGTITSSASGGGGIKKVIILLVFIVILGGIAFGGTMFLRSKSEQIPTPTPFPTEVPTPTSEVTPTPEETPTPTKKAATPTKKPTPAKEATTSATTSSKGLIVRILNGSGIARRAASLADYLKGLGYEIGGTGNAESEDYDKTTINIKKSKDSLLPTLKSDIATKYSVGTTSATLATIESYDAVVIIGKQ